MRLTGSGGAAEGLLQPTGPGSTALETSPLAWLSKLLPANFRAEDLLNALQEFHANPTVNEGKEQQAMRFLLQAFAGAVPRDQDVREGQPSPFFFYQAQEWRGLQVTWQRERREADGKRGPKPPVQVRVETQGRNLGKVDVRISLDDKGKANLDFRNQFHDVREQLALAIPELERNLAFIDFKVENWTYDLLKDEASAAATQVWTRPVVDGGNLDLFG